MVSLLIKIKGCRKIKSYLYFYNVALYIQLKVKLGFNHRKIGGGKLKTARMNEDIITLAAENLDASRPYFIWCEDGNQKTSFFLKKTELS